METLNLDETHFIYGKDYQNQEKRAVCKTPTILIYSPNQWSRILEQKDVDLTEEIKLKILMNIEIITNDIDDIIEIEEKVKNTFKTKQKISEYCDERCVNDATITLNSDKEISHSNFGNGGYKSIIHFLINDIILSKEIINPTKIELDKNAQNQIMMHLCLINMTWDIILIEMENILDSDELKEYGSKNEKIEHMSQGTREKYNNYVQQQKDLEVQTKAMFNFQNLCCIEMSLKKYSFRDCMLLMQKENLDISQACEKMKKDEEQKEREKQHAEEVYTKKGDEVLNEFTDLVVEDFKKKITSDYPISIYGGSTYMRYYYDGTYENLKFPLILITDSAKYNLDYANYVTENEQEQIITHQYSKTSYPIEYGIFVQVIAKSKEELKEIEKKIRTQYQEEVKLKVADPVYENEYRIVKLSINKNIEISYEKIEKDNETIYKNTIHFNRFPNVYYFKSYKTEVVENDSRLQFRLLQQAEFLLVAQNKIQTDLLNPIQKDLKGLLEQPKTTSLFGSLGKKLYDNVFQNAEYKQLKEQFMNRQPIDRTLFNTVFAKTVKYYPDLFDKVMNGWTVEQIVNEIDLVKKHFEKLYLVICRKVGVPYTIDGFVQGSGRNHAALVFYINVMVKSPTYTIESAVEQYKKKLEQDKIAREQERAEREAELAQQSYYDERNSRGGSMLGDIMKTATGVALGNKISGNTNKKGNGKPDLMGSSGCYYGRRPPGSKWTVYCNISCPLYDKCARGRSY